MPKKETLYTEPKYTNDEQMKIIKDGIQKMHKSMKRLDPTRNRWQNLFPFFN